MNLQSTTTNGFNFRIVNSLKASWGVRLTWLDCKIFQRRDWETPSLFYYGSCSQRILSLLWRLISSVAYFFYVHMHVKFTYANKVVAMHERSLVIVKVEPRSTSRLSSAPFYLAFILFTKLKFKCVNVRSQKRVSGNQPWVQLWANVSLFRSRVIG